MAGGVPEVMLHLRRAGLLEPTRSTVSGETLGAMLDWWEQSERRTTLRQTLQEREGVDPEDVIMDPQMRARTRADLHRDFPARQSCAGRLGDQEHGDRSKRGGR